MSTTRAQLGYNFGVMRGQRRRERGQCGRAVGAMRLGMVVQGQEKRFGSAAVMRVARCRDFSRHLMACGVISPCA